MKPEGKVVLIGGGEQRTGKENPEEPAPERDFDILKHLIPKEGCTIEIITTGTAYPRESFEIYQSAFEELKVKNTGMIDITSRNVDRKDPLVKRLEDADTIFIGGGNQRKIIEVLSGTVVSDILKRKYREQKDFILAGTSAGAMCIPEITIGDGFYKNNLIKGDVDIRKGMGLVNGIIADSHFIESKRFARLTLAVLHQRSEIGIGLCEDTGVIITEGEKMECIGNGLAIILDPSEVTETNYGKAQKGERVSVERLITHVLSHGKTFSLRKK